MTEEEKKQHLRNKESDTKYPKLPKWILNNRKVDKNFRELTLDAFYRRVRNYETSRITE